VALINVGGAQLSEAGHGDWLVGNAYLLQAANVYSPAVMSEPVDVSAVEAAFMAARTLGATTSSSRDGSGLVTRCPRCAPAIDRCEDTNTR